MKKLINKQPNSKDCFICGLSNEMGLKASFFETDENEIVCIFHAAGRAPKLSWKTPRRSLSSSA